MSEAGDMSVESKPIDKWIPWMFVLFFVVLAAIDGVFVTIAIKTQTGVVSDRYYEEGVHYNDALAAEDTIENLGWHSEMELNDGNFIVSLKDREMAPLQGAKVLARIERPVQGGHDFDVLLTESGNGQYTANMEFPMPGQWRIRIFAKWQNREYQRSKTFFIPKN